MLTPAHGFVAATVVGSWIVHHVALVAPVIMARKKFNVPYPDLYATPENCKNEEHRKKFNCVQRGHQNALENQPAMLSLLLVAGTKFPITASIAGASYLLGRLLYSQGYSTGNPDSRFRGGLPQYGGLFCLLGCAIRVAVELISGKV